MSEANCAGLGGIVAHVHTVQFASLIDTLRVVPDCSECAVRGGKTPQGQGVCRPSRQGWQPRLLRVHPAILALIAKFKPEVPPLGLDSSP